jgi:diaminohydroxyphosphoribosylaminopyrimidine deaminase/5-amino-6-(5-phosphoribosylamino)uracil reductase
MSNAAPFSPADHAAMTLALQQAELAVGLTEPNPRVGCVLLNSAGDIIGQGHTQQAGGPHAEVMAMRQAREAGRDLRGATAYVTLEPCAHHGRTPPCADALIAAGVARVVAALVDPFPQVAGQGLARLAAAGIATRQGLMAQQARELNIGFLSRVLRQRPWVRLKAAASLDGRTALPNGQSQWITGAQARADGHAWRRRAGAVLTGIGTVLDDNPRLDVRLVDTPRQPRRVVLDRQLRTPPDALILGGESETLLYTHATPEQQERWLAEVCRAQGDAAAVTLVGPNALQPQALGLPDILADLARRGVNELHIEAGARLNGALIQAGLVDEYLFYLAPRLLGPGRGLADLGPLASLSDTVDLDIHDLARVGPDLRLVARPRTAAPDWLNTGAPAP